MTATMSAHYHGEEIQCRFTAPAIQDQEGPGAPLYDVPGDAEINGKICILGVDFDPKELPTALVNSILELAAECEFTLD
jgi:hypothetical protein